MASKVLKKFDRKNVNKFDLSRNDEELQPKIDISLNFGKILAISINYSNKNI